MTHQRDVTRQLVEFVVGTKAADLPDDVVGVTERILLDTIGCTAAGLLTEGGRRLAAVKLRAGGVPESTLIGQAAKVPMTSASYVHAHAADLLDADEAYRHQGHYACCVVMPALAIAEAVDASGEELLAASAIGFDVAARVCTSLPLYDLSVPGEIRLVPGAPVLSAAVLGTAAAAARLLGLDPEQTEQALGLAFIAAPIGRVRFTGGSERRMTKSAFYSPTAEAGVTAALLAQAGFTTNDGMLDAEGRFWEAFGAETCNLRNLLGDLGERWFITETSIKRYPNCRQGHVAIDRFREITQTHGWRASDIDDVVIRVPPVPFLRALAGQNEPRSPIDSQFSIPYAFAMIALGVPTSAWHTPEQFAGSAWRDFVAKIRVEDRPEWYASMAEEVRTLGTYTKVPVEVEVSARGTTVASFADRAPGDPAAPETSYGRDEVADKFREFAAPLLGERKAAEAIEHAWALRDGGPVRHLAAALT